MENNGLSALPHSYMRQRSARVKFQGCVLAILQHDGGHLRVPVHQLSANGGLVNIPDPLNESVRVEVALRVGSTTFRGEAEMLIPMWATRGYLQPFRFTGLGVEQQTELKRHLELLLKKGRGRRALGLHWNLAAAPQ